MFSKVVSTLLEILASRAVTRWAHTSVSTLLEILECPVCNSSTVISPNGVSTLLEILDCCHSIPLLSRSGGNVSTLLEILAQHLKGLPVDFCLKDHVSTLLEILADVRRDQGRHAVCPVSTLPEILELTTSDRHRFIWQLSFNPS